MQVKALLQVRVLCVICVRQDQLMFEIYNLVIVFCFDIPLFHINNDLFHIKWPHECSTGMPAFTSIRYTQGYLSTETVHIWNNIYETI